MQPSIDQPRWRGINHLALITDDMDATVRFYHGVLGASWWRRSALPISATTSSRSAKPTRSRSSSTPTRRSRPSPSRPAFPDPRAVQFDHVSFNVADEHALESLRKRLDGFGCEVTTIVDHGSSVRSTSPTRTASRSKRRTGSRTRPPGTPTRVIASCSPTPTRCPPCASSWTPASSRRRREPS